MKTSRLLSPSLALILVAAAAAAVDADDRRATPAASVTLDGAPIGSPRAVEVHVTASVHTAADRTGMAVRRASAGTAEVRFGAGVAGLGPIFQRLSDALQGKAVRPASTSVVTAAGEYLLRDTTVTEVGFPALDGADDSPLTVSVALSANSVARGTAASAKPARADRARGPLRSSFRLSLGDLDGSRVRRIDAFAFQLSTRRASDKTGRVTAVTGPVTVPPLSIYLDANAQGVDRWLAWIDDVAAGKASNRSGRLELLKPGSQDVVFTLELHDVGISAIHDVVQGERRLLKIDLFVGRAAIGSGPGIAPKAG